MKNLIKISLIITLLFFIFIQLSAYATITSGSIAIETETESYKKDDTLVVTVKLANLNSTKGIITFLATLEYDKECLELIYNDNSKMYMITGENGWSNPTYNPDNGSLVTDRGGLIENGEIFSVSFKILKEKNTSVTVKDIEVADGEGKATLTSSTKEITFNNNQDGGDNQNKNETNQNQTNRNETNQNQTSKNETSQNQVNKNETNTTSNTSTNTNSSTNTNKNTSANTNSNTPDTAGSSLPNAGIDSITGGIIIIAILVIIVLAIIKYIQYKRIDK